jgi:spore coat polysaccharide biosynthesis protein SpsF (cytidylyltransferase family)
MKICSIILARPESSRLPEKHKRLINGKMELEYVIDVCKQVSSITVLATTNDKYYSTFGKLVDKYMYFNINDDDINLRIQMIHKYINADYYLLVSADCPVLSVSIIKNLINLVHDSKKDYIFGTGTTSFCGVDVLRGSKVKDLIETNNICLKLQPKLNGQEIKFNESNQYRITYDNYLDLFFHNCVAKNTDYTYENVIKFLNNNTNISKINTTINNDRMGGKYLFVPSSNSEIGLGHLSRSIAVAEEYNSQGGAVRFLINKNKESIKFMEERGFKENLDYFFKVDDQLYTKVIYDNPNLTTLDWYNLNITNPKFGVSRRLNYYINNVPKYDKLYSFGLGMHQLFLSKFQIEEDNTNYTNFYEKLANYKTIVTMWSTTAREAIFLGKNVEVYTNNKIDAKICRILDKEKIITYKGDIKHA